MFTNDYSTIEAGYTAREIALARKVIGESALAGVGYGRDYRIALRAVRVALATK